MNPDTAETKEMLERVDAVDTAEDLEHGVCGGSGMLLDHLATSAQRNSADRESKLMKTKGGFNQCYSGQVAVDADNQGIVANGLTAAEGRDQKQLEPVVGATEAPATGVKLPREGTCRAEMKHRRKQEGRGGRYRLRNTAVEPVFGQVKQARRLRRFHLRGLPNTQMEWALVCVAHSLTKPVSVRVSAQNAMA